VLTRAGSIHGRVSEKEGCVTDYTVAVIGLVGAGIGAIAGLGGQIVQAWSSGGRERRAAQRTIKLEKRARLQPIYRRLIDAADVARAVAQQKGLAEAGETPEERERRHQEQIDKALKSLREVMNDVILESGSSYVVAAVNDLWNKFSDFMTSYSSMVDAQRLVALAVKTKLPTEIDLPSLTTRTWGLLPQIVAAHDQLTRNIQDHLDQLEQV